MIRYLVMDVDGTLTDGKIYMGEFGEEVKAFDTRYSIIPVIITARESKIEQFKTYETKCLTSTNSYDAERDVEYWKDGIVVSHSILNPGSLITVYNG